MAPSTSILAPAAPEVGCDSKTFGARAGNERVATARYFRAELPGVREPVILCFAHRRGVEAVSILTPVEADACDECTLVAERGEWSWRNPPQAEYAVGSAGSWRVTAGAS